MLRYRQDRELDACGIGFVADARGRPTRQIVTSALEGLARVIHRGALAADARSADGSGLLTPIPAAVYGGLGVAQLFVRGDGANLSAVRAALVEDAATEDIEVVMWREPPVDDSALGRQALEDKPVLVQALLATGAGMEAGGARAERAAFRVRRRLDRRGLGVYVVSCSFRTIVHKGLVAADRLGEFWLDLADDRFATGFAVLHQRFSTNTLPKWERAQPFRACCHNGEINAIEGNVNRMRARHVLGTEAAGLGEEELFHPVLDMDGSDSSLLDNAVELLIRGGRDIRHAVAMLVPEAWQGVKDLHPELKGFYRYHAGLAEPWDGPAGLVFTDGLGVGAALDRNGLRPLRYAVCEDGFIACCSEAGAIDVHGHGTVTRGRLGPGEMIFVDPSRGFLSDADCKLRLAAGPYARWADDGIRRLSSGAPIVETPDADDLTRRQVVHGYTSEELRMILKPMAADAKEPVFSMGDDAPLPHLGGRPRPIHHHLRQRFAQVTNPPIDHLRERPVMSLRTLLGVRSPILSEGPGSCRHGELASFFVYPSGLPNLVGPDEDALTLDCTFAVDGGSGSLRAAIEELVAAGVQAARSDSTLLVVDDGKVTADRAAIPSLLAVGALHHALISAGLRDSAGIVAVADDVRDVHGVACLLGFGADVVSPRLALETVAAEADNSEDDVVSPEAQERFHAAIEDGVLKVMSKMGISTLDSYRGAQTFEVIGLAQEVVDLCLTGATSSTGGIGFDDLASDAIAQHGAAGLVNPGFYRDLKRGGDHHTHNKPVVDALQSVSMAEDAGAALLRMAAAHHLQQAVATGSHERYRNYARLVSDRPPTEPRDLLELVPAPDGPVPLSEVEPLSSILQRFSTGAMSHGSLSAEAHETLARAMNLIGGRSNCGEGGEDPARFATRGRTAAEGYDSSSRIKQVASGRFGVTPSYLANADEIQIKMAQGSKPGEGGQLPGHKVSEEIARLRHTQPGVTLISPPPHHDIYSIEDLAQLVFDLKQVNAFADVSVKLVAGEGVGTIAAGVVKALADVVHISGANGGTGASPLSSIKHAGMPWEVGLADTQRALMENGLRDRVRLRVDGGFLTGRDAMIAALLGADEWSFGTAAMIAEGCIMLRACHKDTCSTGVATQRPHLRAKFAGTPEGVASFFIFVAEEVRELLASLGLRSVDEAVGRVECLRQRSTGDERADSSDLSSLLSPPQAGAGARHYVEGVALQRPRSALGDSLVADAYRAIWEGDEITREYVIANSDRTVGAALSGALALEFGDAAPRGKARLQFVGEAGQSFGAFLSAGINLDLTGEANDYVGKGMAGGRIVVRPPGDDHSLVDGADPFAHRPALAGNTCLYGATGGELFVAGMVGERFGVRNSGAVAVVEGAGDHACEYMTGGTVAVLGRIGYNVGAGMTGGRCYVWDPHAALVGRVNANLVDIDRLDAMQAEELRWLVEQHLDLTRSRRAAALLAAWPATLAQVWLVAPTDSVSRLRTGAATKVSANV